MFNVFLAFRFLDFGFWWHSCRWRGDTGSETKKEKKDTVSVKGGMKEDE